jgi:phosphoglycolate phosphatase-like HAD superfamily hydrolase
MPLDVSRIQALCFDVDGTLSDTDDKWADKIRKLLLPVRFAFPNREPGAFARWLIMAGEAPGNLLYYWLDRFDLDDDVARVYNFISRRNLLYRKRTSFRLVPMVDHTLKQLAYRYPMSVVSARGQQGTMSFLKQFRLHPLFKSVATSQTCQHTKPYPDPIFWAAQKMGVPAENCLMIGDTPVDILAGKQAGAQTVGVLSGFSNEAKLRKAGADIILADVNQLIKILK